MSDEQINKIVKELTFYEKLSFWVNAQSGQHLAVLEAVVLKEFSEPHDPKVD